MGKTDPGYLRDEIEEFHLNGSLVKKYKGEIDIDYYASHSVDFFITAEDLPTKRPGMMNIDLLT